MLTLVDFVARILLGSPVPVYLADNGVTAFVVSDQPSGTASNATVASRVPLVSAAYDSASAAAPTGASSYEGWWVATLRAATR